MIFMERMFYIGARFSIYSIPPFINQSIDWRCSLKKVLHKKPPVSGFLYYKITGPQSEANKKPVNGCLNQAVTKKFTLDGVQVKLEPCYERSPYTNVRQHLALMRSLMELMQPFAKTVFVRRFCYTLYSALKSSVFFVFQIELRDRSFHDRFFCINIITSHMAYCDTNLISCCQSSKHFC